MPYKRKSRKSEDSVTVGLPFFKEKGSDIHDCDDYRGIMMTSHTVNVCGRVIASWGGGGHPMC